MDANFSHIVPRWRGIAGGHWMTQRKSYKVKTLKG
jgi:hypothetical protein